MASLVKMRHMKTLQKCIWKPFNPVWRPISTTKNKSTNTVCDPPPKPWVSYGFDYENEKEDKNVHNASFFFSVSLCLVFGSFAWAYAPDVHMRDWAQREAFLVLRHREKFNEPIVSPHFVNPDFIKLPTEDDLCEIEVII